MSRRLDLALWLALALAVLLQGVAATRQSFTMDEPYHLLAGHQALKTGTNELNYEHPPLVKLLAASAVRGVDLTPEGPVDVTEALPASHRVFAGPEPARRLIRRTRLLLTAAVALPLLAACVWLGTVLFDRRTGLLLAVVVGLSAPTLPYLPLLQTDGAVALGFLLTLVGAVSWVRRPALAPVLLLGAGLAVALAAKFSAVLLLPTAVLALGLGLHRVPTWRRRLGLSLVLAGTVLLLLGASYGWANHSYDAHRGRRAIELYTDNQGTLVVADRLQRWREPLLAVEEVSPAAAQWLTGLLGIAVQNELGIYPSYAFGRVDSGGRAWYFPVVFLIKTPLVLLVALFAAGVERLRGRAPTPPLGRAESWLLGTTLVVYLASALGSSYNLGVRHLLPVMPLLLLPAVRWARERDPRVWGLVFVLSFEALWLSPTWMSATNTWWLGANNPTRLALAGDNLEYEQNYLTLARYVRRHELKPVTVLFPGLTPAELAAYLPEGRSYHPGDAMLPGWYAVSVWLEQMVPALLAASPEEVYSYERYLEITRRWVPALERMSGAEDHGIVAGSYHLYRVR